VKNLGGLIYKERFAAFRTTTNSFLIGFWYQARFGELEGEGRSFSETGEKLHHLLRPQPQRGERA